MKRCTKCNAESEDWQVYCKVCGEKLPETEEEGDTRESGAQAYGNGEADGTQTGGVSDGGTQTAGADTGGAGMFKQQAAPGYKQMAEQLEARNRQLQDELASLQKKKKKGVLWIVLAAVSFGLFLAAAVFCFVLKDESESYLSLYRASSHNLNQLKEEYDQIKPEYDFYHKHAVVVPDDDSGLYHQYGCEEISDDKGFWIYNSEAADSKYQPCPKCMEQ